MIITVAGNKKEVKDGLTVAELIEQEKVETPQYSTSWEVVSNGFY